MFVNSINHFRAVAIVIIVAGHVYGMKEQLGDNLLEAIFVNLTVGCTSLFVFISGFLFLVVFHKSYTFQKFMKSKAYNLLIPYSILSILPILFLFTKDVSTWNEFFTPSGQGIVEEYIKPFSLYYLTGNFMVAYWYIPCIFIVFAMSPIHMMFLKLNNIAQIFTVIALLSLSMFIHRPVDNINIIHSVIYFTPVYLFGMWCALHRERIYTFFDKKEIFLFIIAILLAVIQAMLGNVGNYHKEIFVYDGIDIMLLQKITLCLFFMVWLHRFENIQNTVLDILAKTSFAIFFLHPYMIFLIAGLQPTVMAPIGFEAVYYLALIIPVIAICIASALLAKRILQSSSRYLIGY